MAIDIPSWWWKGVAIGIGLLAAGGALTAVEQGFQDIYWNECQGHRYIDGPNGTMQQPADRSEEDCRSDRLALTWWSAAARATFGPGIAIVVLGGVYLLAAAIGMRRQ